MEFFNELRDDIPAPNYMCVAECLPNFRIILSTFNYRKLPISLNRPHGTGRFTPLEPAQTIQGVGPIGSKIKRPAAFL